MRASVLWTGGKDSALALYKASLAGHEIVNLLTFAPRSAVFLAHPISFMKYQAEAMGISHVKVITDPPLEDGYESAIRSFKEKYKIGALITGDISQVDSMPNWVRQRCAGTSIDVLTPLWGMERSGLFKELISLRFKVIISCVKLGSLGGEWLGRELDDDALEDLKKIHAKTGLDICGENGEYHTMVLDGPLFRKTLSVGGYSKHETDSVMYIKPKDITLVAKVI
ncbi:MAG: diphthine--ammonia ligase [Candidatus Omnitrophota bacterium]|nr:diphthine--ammonia ligase [Candidatus Omnitrophota bacterium]